MTKVVEKYDIESRDKFNRIKNICLRIRRIGLLNDENIHKLVERDLTYLNDYYCKYYFGNSRKSFAIKCMIENALYKSIRTEKSIEIIKRIDADNFERNKNSFMVFYLSNIDKNCNQIINKYFHILVKLNVSRGDYKRFIATYVILKNCNKGCEMVDNIMLTTLEKKSLKYLLNKETKNLKFLNFDTSLIKVVKAIEGYIAISETIIYDDDILRRMLRIRSSSSRAANDLGCLNLIETVFDTKVKYFKENFITSNDLRAVKKFKFKSHIVQNTVFIKSELDNWYVDVDKKNKQSILYHGNDGSPDMYHYQKTFNGTNMYKIYKYIQEHDEYSLRRFDRNYKIKNNRGA